ncbi:PadR family transcriptional regulator [Varunaivibrio sulfuroxidans]|uniref:PadR family transcriptional regulator n=1 Tax=Varunaivibrio sulfuroxidans TaxID=1773489 RepID=A0A4R3JAD7_9PROT|nr:PadR family transcriptional regulator [Varunaivibrio sulfuroxidans]TCS62939.1 PadR family transcriptional regulator [Varunaivibrio sulfuroxidans]WES31985.1 PadR family transcriptional regulator [Varunaivibrio sulfuroxidans]
MDAKILCLGVLTLGDASGYEIRKQFEDGRFSDFYGAGFGSIYPALGQLSAQGLVDCVEMEQHGRPDKKVYSITPTGRALFAEALKEMPGPDKIRSETMFMFFFSEMMDKQHLKDVFDAYLDDHRQRAACLKAHGSDHPCEAMGDGPRFICGVGQAIYEAVVTYMETHRADLLGDDAHEEAGR